MDGIIGWRKLNAGNLTQWSLRKSLPFHKTLKNVSETLVLDASVWHTGIPTHGVSHFTLIPALLVNTFSTNTKQPSKHAPERYTNLLAYIALTKVSSVAMPLSLDQWGVCHLLIERRIQPSVCTILLCRHYSVHRRPPSPPLRSLNNFWNVLGCVLALGEDVHFSHWLFSFVNSELMMQDGLVVS